MGGALPLATLVVATGIAVALAACASTPDAPPGAPLDGAALLERTCTVCHGLEGLAARAPYWGEREWADLVETMIGYGAVLSEVERPVLVRHLGEEY